MTMDAPVDERFRTFTEEELEAARLLNERLGVLDPQQIRIWRAMTPARRAEIAFQAYQLALDAVRASERQRHPELSEAELAWRVTRRLPGDPPLGRGKDGERSR